MPSMMSNTRAPSLWQSSPTPTAGPNPVPVETPIPYAVPEQPAAQPSVAPIPLPDLYSDEDGVCVP